MTTLDFLKKILEQQSLKDDSDEIKSMKAERDKVEKIIREKFKDCNPTIKYGGSKAKGTMIKDSYDLDVLCYFEQDDTQAGDTLEEIFNNVKKELEDEYFVQPKTSALRLEKKGDADNRIYFHIDVVPGRFTDDKKEDAYLHQNNGDKKYLKTNPDKHISHIKDSGLQKIIKLIKFWKKRNNLQIKTFVLELLVVKILKNCDSDELEKCLLTFWNEVKDDYETLTVEDPANPNGNDLSSLLDYTVRYSLYMTALNSISFANENKWNLIFGEIETESNSNNALKISVIESIREKTRNPSKPWAEVFE